MKRAHWPANLEEAKAGGFVVSYTPAGAPVYRNPCTAQFLVMLPNLLALIRYIVGDVKLFVEITASYTKDPHKPLFTHG